MSLRGRGAIVGIGEVPTRRIYEGRSMYGLCAEAAGMAIADAGITKDDIDGLVTDGVALPPAIAEYLDIKPNIATGVSMQGASGATATMVATSAVSSGICNTVLVVMGNSRQDAERAGRPAGRGAAGPSVRSEWEEPHGMAPGANTGYGLMYRRHIHEYGTTEDQLAKMAADQRFNALENENAVFNGQPISKEDVLNSRYINEPLKLLESVMPCDGAAALIITTPERAKNMKNKPAYVLGVGLKQGEANIWQRDKFTETPAVDSVRRALEMSGYTPSDIEFAEFYDCYTILAAMCIEDAGLVEKGEIGPFYEETDTTYKGDFPINTDGGQLSGGQPGLAGGFRHVIEGARQIMGKAGSRQVEKSDLCLVNG